MRSVLIVHLSLICLILAACADNDDVTPSNAIDATMMQDQAAIDAQTVEDSTIETDGGTALNSDGEPPVLEDMMPPRMPEGEGELWHMQVALNEFGVEVPFQLELKRAENTFEFARLRATKEGVVSAPMNWVFDIPIDEDGTFTIEFDRMTIPGDFSPTLDDVDIVLNIAATEVDENGFCGLITGEVIDFETVVTTSTFGAVPWGTDAPYPSKCAGDVQNFDPIEACPAIQVGDNEGFPSAGLERRFRVFIPETYDPAVPTPIVVGYHGKNGAEWPWGRVDLFVEESDLPNAANTEGSILVLMASQDLGSEWESGSYGPTRDLAFFDDLLTCMKMSFNIDENRIHVTGHSAGSYQAAMLTLTRGDVIASSALASTGLLMDYVQPEVQIPTIVIWGGEEDISFMQDFHRQTLSLIESFVGGGHILMACQNGHLPLIGDNSRHTWQPPTNPWIFDFFAAHPKGTDTSPYADTGIPANWADYCELYPQ